MAEPSFAGGALRGDNDLPYKISAVPYFIIMVKAFSLLVRMYQGIARIFPQACRFHPSCSQYAIDAVQKYGIRKGTRKALVRILKCSPFSSGGYDPLM